MFINMFTTIIAMKVISLNVSLPKTVEFRGNPVSTGIYNEPVEGRRKVRTLNIDGDQQADLTVHGGPDKAVYAYPSEHYPYWKEHYPDLTMDWGMFGENFTTEGLLEDQTNIGDEYQIGSAKFAVTQPRMPCYKLAIKFESGDIIKKLFTNAKCGIYFKVLEEGDVGAGDEIKLVRKDENNVTIQDIMKTYGQEHNHKELLERAVKIDALPVGWKDHYRQILQSLQ